MQDNGPIISAGAALLGACIGGVISYFANSSMARERQRHEQRMREIEKREDLYSEFIAEVSRLLILIVEKEGCGIGEFTKLSGLQSQIRIISSPEVSDAGKDLVKRIMRNAIRSKDQPQDQTSADRKETGDANNHFADIAKAELEKLKASNWRAA